MLNTRSTLSADKCTGKQTTLDVSTARRSSRSATLSIPRHVCLISHNPHPFPASLQLFHVIQLQGVDKNHPPTKPKPGTNFTTVPVGYILWFTSRMRLLNSQGFSREGKNQQPPFYCVNYIVKIIFNISNLHTTIICTFNSVLRGTFWDILCYIPRKQQTERLGSGWSLDGQSFH